MSVHFPPYIFANFLSLTAISFLLPLQYWFEPSFLPLGNSSIILSASSSILSSVSLFVSDSTNILSMESLHPSDTEYPSSSFLITSSLRSASNAEGIFLLTLASRIRSIFSKDTLCLLQTSSLIVIFISEYFNVFQFNVIYNVSKIYFILSISAVHYIYKRRLSSHCSA